MKLIKKVSEHCVMPNGISYCLNSRVGKLWAIKIPLPFRKKKFSVMCQREVIHRLYVIWSTARGIRFLWLDL